MSRFRRLYGNLKSAFARPALKKMMGAAAVVLMSIGGLQAQQFAAPVQDTFGLLSLGNCCSNPEFVDIDSDGDLDMFSGKEDGSIYFFENIGTANAPSFSAPIQDTFGLSDVGDYSNVAFVDLDGDGDMDLFSGEYAASFYYFENTGSSSMPSFASPIQDTFGLTDLVEYNSPTFVDLDGDGDMDMFSGETYSNFYYYENIGDTFSASFTTSIQNPYGLTTAGSGLYGTGSSPVVVDFDSDGDLDLISGDFNGSFYFYENSSSSTPSFSAPAQDTLGTVDIGFSSTPTFIDLDNDGDLDIMSGAGDGSFYYFENLTVNTSINNVIEKLGLSIYPNPVSEDLTIELTTSANYQIRITDLTGREIYSEFVQNDNNLQLSTQAWPAGLYLLQVRDEEGRVETKKIVKR